jgi:uncharacterized protein HemX
MLEQEEIKDVIKKHKAQTLKALAIGFAFVIVLAICFNLFYDHRTSELSQKVQSLQDSLKVHNQQRVEETQRLRASHDSDIARISILEEELNNTDATLAVINSKYDKIRHNVAHSSVDDKLRFLSGRLPKGGATR